MAAPEFIPRWRWLSRPFAPNTSRAGTSFCLPTACRRREICRNSKNPRQPSTSPSPHRRRQRRGPSLLEELAKEAHGKSYFLDDPTKIPQVISGETRDLQASTVEERPVKVVRVRPVEFIDGIDFAHAPRLLGFAKEKAKANTETILKLDSGEPLAGALAIRPRPSCRIHVGRQGSLVRGLGQVEILRHALAPDGAGRLASRPHRARRCAPRQPRGRVDRLLRRDERCGNRLTAKNGAPAPSPSSSVVPSQVPPQVMVNAPGEAPHAVQLEETAPGHYEARVQDNQRGLYTIVAGNSELALPEAGFYRESEETRPRRDQCSAAHRDQPRHRRPRRAYHGSTA